MNITRAVFFDAVGTLLHPEPSAASVYAQVGRRFGSHYTQREIALRFAAAFRKQEAIDRGQGWITSAERERRRWREIVSDVLDDVSNPDDCFGVLYDHFARPESWRCEPGIEALFMKLAEHGFRLGLASNYDERLHLLVDGLRPLWPLHAHVVVSSEIGYRKPAAEFFHALCANMGLEAGQICHVGDDLANDYHGALAAGMRAILFDPRGKHAGQTSVRIRHLDEIAEVICPA